MNNKAGLVRLSIACLDSIFANTCKVQKVFITDEDAKRETITLLVSDHAQLPELTPDSGIPEVDCLFIQNPDGTQSVTFRSKEK